MNHKKIFIISIITLFILILTSIVAFGALVPNDPINLENTTGTDWINHTWAAGSGNITDSFNVSVNGTWYNDTTDLFFNDTYPVHDWQNITVWAYNSSDLGALSQNNVSQNTQIPNSPVTITNTSNWNGSTGSNVYVDFDSTDADGDIPIFSCNRTDLFTDFNTGTGQGNWTVTDGIYTVDFGVSDEYGSTDNYTMSIMGDMRPEDPENLGSVSEILEIIHRWTPGGDWYLITGGESGDGIYSGYNWTGTTWQSDSAIEDGLDGDYETGTTSDVFSINNTYYLIGGWTDGIHTTGYFTGFNWTGAAWQTDDTIKNGLVDVGPSPTICVFEMNDVLYLLEGAGNSGDVYGYNWTGTTWQSDSAISNGLDDFDDSASPFVFQMGTEWYLINGEDSGVHSGYMWNETIWESYSTIASGTGDIGTWAHPTVFQMNDTWYLITGEYYGSFNGFNWTGTEWQSDTAIVSNLADVGIVSAPNVFQMVTGNITDSYNISINDVWYNNTPAAFNDTYSPHGWQNITVWAYNSTGSGTLSENSISHNAQLVNNLVSITNTSYWDDNYGENVYVDFDSTDADGDTPTFSCNRTDMFTDFNSVTGQGNWTAIEEGVIQVDFGVSEEYGSTDNYTMSIIVGSPTLPPDPFNIANTSGTDWINHTWEVLSGEPDEVVYLISGDQDGNLYGFDWTGATWETNSDLLIGLTGNIAPPSSPTMLVIDDTLYLIDAGNTMEGFKWNGTGWESYPLIADGIAPRIRQTISAFELDGSWHIMCGGMLGNQKGYRWTGTTWEVNNTIITGLSSAMLTNPTVHEIDGELYYIDAGFTNLLGYIWNGTAWESDSDILSGLPAMSGVRINMFELDGVDYFMRDTSTSDSTVIGYNWTGTTWQSDSAIVSNLGTTEAFRITAVAEYTEEGTTITDSFNISVNDVWYNGTTDTFFNDTYSGHEWQNITVRSYNSTFLNSISENSINQDTQVTNNPVTLLNVSASYSLNEGETVHIDANYSDLDGDSAVFSDNASNWTINTTTGVVSWITNYTDSGIHSFRITVDDLFGSTDFVDINITVNDTPLSLVSSSPDSSEIEITTSGSQTLSITMSRESTIVWYIDEVEYRTDEDSTTSNYYFTSSTGGLFNVTAVVDGTNISETWMVTVTGSSSILSAVKDTYDKKYIMEEIEEVEKIFEEIEEIFEDIITPIKSSGTLLLQSTGTVIEKIISFVSVPFNWVLILFAFIGAFIGTFIGRSFIISPEDEPINIVLDIALAGTLAIIMILLVSLFAPVIPIGTVTSVVLFATSGMALSIIIRPPK